MKKIQSFISFLLFVLLVVGCTSPKDNGNALQTFIDEELQRGNTYIVVPPGEYRVHPSNQCHLTLSHLKDVTIDATGVRMICLETVRAIDILDCDNLTLKGLTVDYDPLCFTQGRITYVSDDHRVIEFRVDSGYPEDRFEGRIEIYDGQSKTLKCPTCFSWGKWEKIGEHLYRISKGDDYKGSLRHDKEEVGDILATNNIYAPGGYNPHTIFSENCRHLTLDSVTIYSGNCFGYFEMDGTRNTYHRCVVDRCPITEDYTRRAMRIRSTNADAFHSKHALIGPRLLGCTARFQGDDGLNISSVYTFSLGAQGNTIRLASMGQCWFAVGDSLEVVTYDGQRIKGLQVIAVEEGDTLNRDERAAIRCMPAHEPHKRRLLSRNVKVFHIKVNQPVHFDIGAVVNNPTRQGNGFIVQDCEFSYNRSRGILIKASNGKIIHNTFVGTWGVGVLVTPETWWLGSGCSDNLLIQNNQFIDMKCRGALSVTGTGFSRKPGPAGLHVNILVCGNQFQNSPFPVIHMQAVKGGNINGNTWGAAPWNEAVEMVNCTDITR